MSKKAQIKYIDLPRFFPGIYVGYTNSKKKLDKEFKRLKINDMGEYKGRAGRVWAFTNQDKLTLIFFLDKNFIPDDSDIINIYGLFVHETTHIVDYIYDHIGERQKTDEINSYLHQYIFEELARLYKEKR